MPRRAYDFQAIEQKWQRYWQDRRVAAVNTALIPVARLEPDFYDWFARHHAVLDLARRIQPNVVMIGDSITQAVGDSNGEEWGVSHYRLRPVHG